MKRATGALALVLLLVSGVAHADKIIPIWAAQTAPAQTVVDTSGYQTAQVSIWAASGSPDGTVTIYLVPPGDGPLMALASYATPTTVKTFRGPAGVRLAVALTGNSTGTVAAYMVLK